VITLADYGARWFGQELVCGPGNPNPGPAQDSILLKALHIGLRGGRGRRRK